MGQRNSVFRDVQPLVLSASRGGARGRALPAEGAAYAKAWRLGKPKVGCGRQAPVTAVASGLQRGREARELVAHAER